MKPAKKPKPPKKPKLTAAEKASRRALAKTKREEAKFRNSAKEIFLKSGFKFIASENKEFKFSTADGDRTTELDGVFAYENIVIVMEDTCTQKTSEHIAKKSIIFELALKNKTEFIECLNKELTDFKTHYDSQQYSSADYELRIVYFSMHSVDTQYIDSARRIGFQVIERALTNYFHALVKNIHSSAKYEILKFLKIAFSDVGIAKISGGSSATDITYKGFLLPEANSSYPDGYKVVSFYADPASLLAKSFVLRKNGWITPNLSYQRILDMTKIREMRRYLSENKRVYLSNIIATLPSSTIIQDIETRNQLSAADQNKVKPITISIPSEYNVIGLIDGQHRVYSYHEGVDSFDTQIKMLRMKQNLLVTGIIYPNNISEEDRVLFEARLFLEINSKQTKVKSALTQEIELIVNPYSPIAVAKAILMKLARSGALKDKLEEHAFDDGQKLKVSSIISYGLKPLTKKEGEDSLFTAWHEASKKEDILALRSAKSLEDFIDYCAYEINLLLNVVKKTCSNEWIIGDEKKILTPTSINGFIKCLRIILENKDTRSFAYYESKLPGIENFNFTDYKSSHWNQLGIDLYEKFFK
ncbi:DGQHR domain-containing protein [Pseudomonas syringae pv. syringae]|uniref:DGQHR domain-containing protein n=1 Tax=Pseudomonas syringae TaxID=317 RepID=UPI00200A2985|nr:DGQHR domain-containing protein [Pseudomonas syringae]MCK9701881.1 DGQHR domain-containing protein [Pseudomonas syringae pv. syringae]MCK9757377.1 DGQHR domain-containing protein [Pseudomonas syringae pv. syringae]MCK9773608.1 DGQHR domain-containing protein [Pseudomonas syringae pv. syringae]